MSARDAMSARDIEDTYTHVRLGLENSDFYGAPRYSTSSTVVARSNSPYFDQDGQYSGHYSSGAGYKGPSEMQLDNLVWRTNLAVQLANGNVRGGSSYWYFWSCVHMSLYGADPDFSEIQPKMTRDGRFPDDFRRAKSVDTFRTMDAGQLDRIMSCYLIAADLRAAHTKSKSSIHKTKLIHLLDFLGCYKVVDHEREALKRDQRGLY